MRKEMERKYWLYEYAHNSIESFLDHVSQITHGNQRTTFNLLVISAKEDPEKLFSEWIPYPYKLKIIQNGIVMSIKLINQENKIQEPTPFVVLKHPSGLYLVVSDCSTNQFAKIMDFLRRYYPSIARVYLTNKEVYDILEKFEKSELTITVDRLIAYSRIETTERKKVAVTYTSEPFKKVFREAAENSQWIDKIKFTAYKESTLDNGNRIKIEEFIGYISRGNFFKIKKNFKLFFDVAVNLAIQYCVSKNDYLQTRAIKAKDPMPEPMIIKYDRPIFETPDDNKRLINLLAELKGCSVSTYHSNPYLHISLLDFFDGSSYDVWVVSSDNIIFIPQLTASVPSMTRILNHVFERFEEGKIIKYEQIPTPNI
jgi:hypothetical protein